MLKSQWQETYSAENARLYNGKSFQKVNIFSVPCHLHKQFWPGYTNHNNIALQNICFKCHYNEQNQKAMVIQSISFFVFKISPVAFSTVQGMLCDYIMEDWGFGWQLRYRKFSLNNRKQEQEHIGKQAVVFLKFQALRAEAECPETITWNYRVVRNDSKSKTTEPGNSVVFIMHSRERKST